MTADYGRLKGKTMAYKRFIDQQDVAFGLLKWKLEESHGKLVGDLKTQVGTLSFLDNISRFKLPGMASNWNRIANEETFVIGLLRGSFFLSASNPVVEKHLKKWHVPSTQNVMSLRSLDDALRNGHEINGVIVENHYIGLLWYPQYSNAQSVFLLGVQFVKLAAAITATVLTAGAAAGSIVTTVSEGAATLGALKSAASAVGEVVTKGLEAKEALDGARGQWSAGLDRPQSASAGPRQGVTVGAGSLQDRNIRSALGIDLSEIHRGAAASLSEEQRKQDAERISRMTFAVVQSIRPARSAIDGDTDFIETHKDGVSRIMGLRYKAKMEVHRHALVRIGPSKLEVVSGAAKSFEAMAPNLTENLLLPWDSRSIRDAGAEFAQFSASSGLDGGLSVLGETSDLFEANWDHGTDKWQDTGERHCVETNLAQNVIDETDKILAAFRHKFAVMKVAKMGVRQWANRAKVNHQARQVSAQQSILAARNRLLPTSQAFLREVTERNFLGMEKSRSPYLNIVGEIINKTQSLPDDAFRQRFINLKSIAGALENYSNQYKNLASPTSPAIANLKAAVKAELAAIEASPGWMELAIEDEFDII